MKSIRLLPVTLLWITTIIAQAQSELTLWYDEPAEYFEEAMVIGNGTMGATVFGGVHDEKIYLNEATLWSGEPVNPSMNPEAHKWIPQIRAALKEENYQLADSLQRNVQGSFSQSYMPLGTMHMNIGQKKGTVKNYRRQLDLNTAITSVNYTIDDVNYNREYFISQPDQIFVVRLTSDTPTSFGFRLGLESQLRCDTSHNNNQLILDGYAPYHVEPSYRGDMPDAVLFDENRGTRFVTIVDVEHNGVDLVMSERGVSLTGASEATLYISMATSFNGFDKNPATEGVYHLNKAKKNLANAKKYTYDQLKERHVQDYSTLFSRVKLELEDALEHPLPTDDRLRLYTAGAEDQDLEILYFQFGRYLLIASSRTPEVPANLQGIWNPHLRPPWSSNYTININAQENYWGAEIGNLSELHQPMLSFIKNVASTGQITAQEFFGTNGWAACHNSDIWAMSNPVGDFGKGQPKWANWNMGGTWLSTHLWEHYLYTQDKEYLKHDAYEIMKGAAIFALDWLVEDDDGYLITSPTTSPENDYITDKGYKGSTLYGASADIAMIKASFDQVIKASEILGIDKELRGRLLKAKKKLRPYQIGDDGSLQEWYHDWKDVDPRHRHQTHLWGLHPGREITPDLTPKLAAACRSALEIKGDQTTGWSKGWRINLWARLWDGDRAYKMYRELLDYVEPDGKRVNGAWNGGGTYPNLFDAHPPFQIDGNFGGSAAVIEMIAQSSEERILLLPALPKVWHSGSLSGVKMIGGYELSLDWKDGRPTVVRLKSISEGEVTLQFESDRRDVTLKAGEYKEIVW